MSDYSISVEVVLDFEGENDTANVVVEGHNLPEALVETIARHYLAVELGVDVEEMTDVFLVDAEHEYGVSSLDFSSTSRLS